MLTGCTQKSPPPSPEPKSWKNPIDRPGMPLPASPSRLASPIEYSLAGSSETVPQRWQVDTTHSSTSRCSHTWLRIAQPTLFLRFMVRV